MKNLLDTLKSARWVEMLLLFTLIAILLAVFFLDAGKEPLSAEARMARILSSVSGAGHVQVMQGGENGGILVLSEGAEDISVMLSLQRAVHTLTGLPIEKIEIAESR